MNAQFIEIKGNRAVVINETEERVWANLYVNAREGLNFADITTISWKGRTLKGARKWAAKQLAA